MGASQLHRLKWLIGTYAIDHERVEINLSEIGTQTVKTDKIPQSIFVQSANDSATLFSLNKNNEDDVSK